MLSLICGLILTQGPPKEFQDFLTKKDSAVSWRIVREDNGQTEIELTSQTWQGTTWKHGILVQQPPKVEFKGTGVLYITGDGPRDGDRAQIRLLSNVTGMPVAMLFGIPNQPIWNMREDDLIAHTFERYLATKDPSWPLLFPMTKSALRAMDAVEAVTKKSNNPLKKFLVTGASKRGWTTWLVGASGDKRVAGIAPMVYDNLNIPVQMKHQIDSWGEYSLQIQDYTRRGLQAKLETPLGKRLSAMVDPYSYRDKIKVPTMIVNGGNDPYWTVDALSLYWNDLKQPKWARVIPNVGHDLGGGFLAIETIGMFGRSLAGAFKMPQANWKIGDFQGDRESGGKAEYSIKLNSSGGDLEKVTIWGIENWDSSKFADKKWTTLLGISGQQLAAQKGEVKVNVAYFRTITGMFAEFRYRVGTRSFSITTPVAVVAPY